MAKDVDWYGEDVKLAVQNVGREALLAIAFQVIAEAKPDVPIDTGFLRNSDYVVGAGKNTFISQTDDDRRTVPSPPPVADNEVIAGFAADYAIHVETRHPFLYPALLRVRQQVDGIIKQASKL